MLTANDIMTKNPLTVTPDMEITKAVNLLLEKKINGLPVVDNTGKLVGILCQSDLVALQKTLPLPSVFSFMDGFFPTISLTMQSLVFHPLVQLFDLFFQGSVIHLPRCFPILTET